MTTIAKGTTVTINDPKNKNGFHSRTGLVVAQHPPKGDAYAYVVRVGVREYIFPTDKVEANQ